MRQKPESHRRRVALMLSAGATLFLFAVWAATIPAQFADINGQSAAVSASTPLDSLKQNFGDSYTSLRDNLSSGPGAGVTSDDASYVSNGVVLSDATSTSANQSSY